MTYQFLRTLSDKPFIFSKINPIYVPILVRIVCTIIVQIEKIESTTWVPQRIETPDLKSLLQQDIYQICPYFSQDLDELFLKKVDHLKLERWIDFFADMVPIEGEKPQGIKKVLELWGLEKEYIAFGDGGNDLAMLQEASLGIAMGKCQ